MATLFTIVYPEIDTAEAALETVKGLESAGFATVADQATVKKDSKGKVHVDGTNHPVRTGAIAGGVIGGFVGAVFFLPVAGIAAGSLLGGAIGKSGKSGASADFKSFSEEIQQEMQPGNSALVVLGETKGRDRVVHELGRHGGKLYSYDLTDKQIADIQHELDKASR